MAKLTTSISASGTIALCTTAALLLTVSPVTFEEVLASPAYAQGQGSGGGGGGGSSSSGGGSGGSGGGGGGNAGGSDSGQRAGQSSDDGASKPTARAGSQGSKAPAPPRRSAGAGGGASEQPTAPSGRPMQDSDGGKDFADIMRDVTGDDGDDSDRPDWAGVPGGKDGAGGGQPPTAGSTKGDLFGDLYVIARDDNGIPILTPEGWVQPLDADGNPIPLDDEGHPIDETLTVEVEIGRLNVSRAPSQVLDRRADEVVTLMNTATDLTTDAAGRLVFTVDGDIKTIDSPLENLSIYIALMTTGTIPGVDDLPGTEFDFMVDGALTAADLAASPVFLAAATDKTGVFTTDEIAYIDAFLGINIETVGDVAYSNVDYSGFSYDRAATYSGVTAEVLVLQDDGTWMAETVDVYDAVFDGSSASDSGTLTAYTLAADDARAVVEFIHEYAVPAAELTPVSN